MTRVLFVCYGGGHVGMIIPIVEAMRKSSGWEPIVMGLTIAKPKLDAAGIHAYGFRDLVSPSDGPALAMGKRLLAGNFDSASGVSEEESIAYLGLNYADLERRLGPDQARHEYERKGRHAFLPLGPLRRAIDRFRPDVVVATNSPKSERAAVMVASELGIPTAVIIDLFWVDWDFLADPNHGDRVCVMAPRVADEYVRRGRHRQSMVVTGNPAFDRLADPRYANQAADWRLSHQVGTRKVVLWADAAAGCMRADHRLIVLDQLAQIAQSNPNLMIMYRPHPGMGSTAPKLPPEIRISSLDTELPIHLQAADLLITTISTCATEAALLDKPIIKLQFTDPAYRIYDPSYHKIDAFGPYEQIGFVHLVKQLELLESGIQLCLSPCPESAALKAARQALVRPGQAAERIVSVLTELALQGTQRKVGSPANRRGAA